MRWIARGVAAVVTGLWLTSCGGGLAGGLTGDAKRAVSSRLKDPSSVQFKDVQIVQLQTDAGPTPIVCGEFNAKNSFGGYVGYERFAWHPEGKLLDASLTPGVDREVVLLGIEQLCNGTLPKL